MRRNMLHVKRLATWVKRAGMLMTIAALFCGTAWAVDYGKFYSSDQIFNLAYDTITKTLVTENTVARKQTAEKLFAAGWMYSAVTNNSSACVVVMVSSWQTVNAVVSVAAAGDAWVELYENPVIDTSSGNVLSGINLTRVSSVTATAIVYSTPCVTTPGTRLYSAFTTGGTLGITAEMPRRPGAQWVFTKGRKYYIVLTNKAGSTKPASINLEWFEEN